MKANEIVLGQKQASEEGFYSSRNKGFIVHTTKRPLTRFLSDRRLKLAV